MERLLRTPCQLTFQVLMAIVVMAMVVNPAFAASYSGSFTGYAMGGWDGLSGVQLFRGYYANHVSDDIANQRGWPHCTNDPSRNWAWGTQITSVSPQVPIRNYANNVVNYSSFYLYDGGDINCNEGPYWSDIYFGRDRYSADACSCPGVSGSVCVVNQTNSCINATTVGRVTRSFVGP